jgi:hypothetical protein
VLVGLCAGAVCGRARADPFHQQTLPLGQRAIGMGGAFTAVADDPSATYYNPAGLVLTNDSSLSASLTLQAFDKSTLQRGYRTSEGASSLHHSAETSLPVFISAIKLLGKRDADGQRNHAIGLSSFTVSQRRISFDVESRVGSTLNTLQVSNSEKTNWLGISYAYRLTKRLSFGLSGFLSFSKTTYTEERISAALGQIGDDSSFDSDSNAFASHLVKTRVKSMLGRLGGLYAVNDRLQLGLMVQPPSIHIRGAASVRDRSLVSNTMIVPGESSVFNARQGKLLSKNPEPWEVRLGARYELYDWLTLAIDGSLIGPSGSKDKPIIAVGPRKPDPETGAVPQVGAFMSETWYRNYSGNVSIGASASLPRTITLRAGLYTDLSSAPSVPKVSATFYEPDVNRVGGTLSVGLRNEGLDLSVGCIGVFGRGNALAFNADPDAEHMYQRTKMTDRMFLFFLNGVKSAISTLAKKAEKTLMEIKESREEARVKEQQEEARAEPSPDEPVAAEKEEPIKDEPPAARKLEPEPGHVSDQKREVKQDGKPVLTPSY